MGSTDSGKQIAKRKALRKIEGKNPNESEGRNNKSYTHIKPWRKSIESKRHRRVFLKVILLKCGKDLEAKEARYVLVSGLANSRDRRFCGESIRCCLREISSH